MIVDKQKLHMFLIFRAGTPPTMTFSSTLLLTTAPAATIDLDRTHTPAKILEPAPIQISSEIVNPLYVD